MCFLGMCVFLVFDRVFVVFISVSLFAVLSLSLSFYVYVFSELFTYCFFRVVSLCVLLCLCIYAFIFMCIMLCMSLVVSCIFRELLVYVCVTYVYVHVMFYLFSLSVLSSVDFVLYFVV